MPETNNKTTHQRSTIALERRKAQGLKIDNAYSPRHIAVMQDFGIVDENGRLPRTRKPERSHYDTRRGKISKKAAGLALAVTAAAGIYGFSQISPEGGEPPSPANMPEFQSDPLQAQYGASPESFQIIGGELQQIPTEHLGKGAEG